jgi:predicted DNA-binding transcriptional regulator AlpA
LGDESSSATNDQTFVAMLEIFPYYQQSSMRRKRSAHNLTTAQVARVLGIGKKTLYRMLQDGRIQEPVRNPENNYRVWIPQEIEAIRQEMSK